MRISNDAIINLSILPTSKLFIHEYTNSEQSQIRDFRREKTRPCFAEDSSQVSAQCPHYDRIVKHVDLVTRSFLPGRDSRTPNPPTSARAFTGVRAE